VTDITPEPWRAARSHGTVPVYRRPMVFTEITPSRKERTMSTRTAALPIEKRYLLRAWIVVSAIVIAASLVVAFALTAGRDGPAGSGIRTDTTGRIVDYGPATKNAGPMVLANGMVCGQCR
jgi:hypothetical protein